ncbi:MAG: T9SS type A sorting domain-containing protein [Ignavibacteria bacterium]|jgi:hypothetical protein|nr:T9SS type A sorting domain-containing protein [Ignavibacteria bacterium]
MRKPFLFILGITVACFVLSNTPTVADVYNQFARVTYRDLWRTELKDFRLHDTLQSRLTGIDPALGHTFTDGSTIGGVKLPNEFRIYHGSASNYSEDANLDDGYALVPLGFTYRYNNQDYTHIYVSINGFVTFDLPPGLPEITRNPEGLFYLDMGSMPNNVIAPFWGNHKYWQNNRDNLDSGLAPSQIGYVHYKHEVEYPAGSGEFVEINACLIQWKDLNVNYLANDGITKFKGNVTSFQMVIYEGPDAEVAKQGEVVFRYGEYGPTKSQEDNNKTGQELGTSNSFAASIGFKGNTPMTAYNQADFINAIYNGFWPDLPASEFYQKNYTTLNSRYTPLSPGVAIVLEANYSIKGDENWGDGDADMSKAEGGRHLPWSSDPKRFVTINDVRTIMRSIAINEPLDSLFGNAAFHGDVHHDGRYYYMSKNDAGIYRQIAETGEYVLNNQDALGADNPDDVDGLLSRDTFYLRKVGLLEGGYGFDLHHGDNANYIDIDFYNSGLVTVDNKVRRFRIVETDNSNLLDPAYQIRIAVIDPNDRELLWAVSENTVNLVPGNITFRLKKNIIWRTNSIYEEVEWIQNPKAEIFYEANELDASFILSYFGALIPRLPWIYENPIFDGKGKLTTPYKVADNIVFDNAELVNGYLKVPVYYNGLVNGAASVAMNINVNILNFESASSDVLVDYSNVTKNLVAISDGSFDPTKPIAYLTIENTKEFTATNIRFSGKNVNNVTYKAEVVLANTAENALSQNTPNPVLSTTSFNVNISNAGTYRLSIYDMSGNLVKVIANGEMGVGTTEYTWNATNTNGNRVSEGTYFYKLEGDNFNATKKMIVIK